MILPDRPSGWQAGESGWWRVSFWARGQFTLLERGRYWQTQAPDLCGMSFRVSGSFSFILQPTAAQLNSAFMDRWRGKCAPMFSFRMISDTRIECRDASSQRETAQIGPTGTDRGGVEPGRAGSVGVDGFLSSLPQRGPYRPSLRDQSPDVLSLAAPL